MVGLGNDVVRHDRGMRSCRRLMGGGVGEFQGGPRRKIGTPKDSKNKSDPLIQSIRRSR